MKKFSADVIRAATAVLESIESQQDQQTKVHVCLQRHLDRSAVVVRTEGRALALIDAVSKHVCFNFSPIAKLRRRGSESLDEKFSISVRDDQLHKALRVPHGIDPRADKRGDVDGSVHSVIRQIAPVSGAKVFPALHWFQLRFPPRFSIVCPPMADLPLGISDFATCWPSVSRTRRADISRPVII